MIFFWQAAQKEPSQVFDEVAALLYDLLPHKQQYNQWVTYTNIIQFPDYPKEVDMR